MTKLLLAEDLEKSYVTSRSFVGRPTKRYGAVRGVSFDVGVGETVGLVGESGAGKSTIGRIVLRLIQPDAGSVTFDGEDISTLRGSDLRKFRARARMIFQDPFSSLDSRMTVGQALEESYIVHSDLKRSERRQRVVESLQSVGLTAGHAERYPYEMSGGQLQRVAIARAMAPEPALVVCDEPVAALDVSIRAHILNLLADLGRQRCVSYLFVSHDLSLVRMFCDRMIVLYAGRVVEEGSCARVFAEPRHPYTRSLLSAVPSVDPGRRRILTSTERRATDGVSSPVAGCRFNDRCPIAIDRCRTDEPELVQIGDVRVACHLVADLVPTAVPLAPPSRSSTSPHAHVGKDH